MLYRPTLHDKEKGTKSHKMPRHHGHGHGHGHELGKLKRQYLDYYVSVTNVGVWFVNLLSAEQKNHTQILLRWLVVNRAFYFFSLDDPTVCSTKVRFTDSVLVLELFSLKKINKDLPA